MGENLAKVSEDNFNTYTKMIKYIRNLKMLDVHKREVTQKLYNMYTNLSKKEASLEEYVVNPKSFCDTVCKEYVNNTPIYTVYLEAVKKFSLVIAAMCLAFDMIFKKSLVSSYFVYILVGTFIISMILTYLKLYRSEKYGLDEETLLYKVIYNTISVIMIVPIFLVKDIIRVNENISTLNIGIACILVYFIFNIITKIHKNKINKKINYKGII